MSNEVTLEAIRAVVRDELARFRRPARSLRVMVNPHAASVRRFLATLPPGQVRAAALYQGWHRWSAASAPQSAGITATAFGRLAVACADLVARNDGSGRRVYTVLPPVVPAALAGVAAAG